MDVLVNCIHACLFIMKKKDGYILHFEVKKVIDCYILGQNKYFSKKKRANKKYQ